VTPSRVAWVDYAKGLCIILVVMMHSVTSYGVLVHDWGFLHEVVDFARPFRMPDFFLISGLFLSRTINAPLREYVDKKVLHFIYFYLIWLVIEMAIVEIELLSADPMGFVRQFLFALIEPYETMWFVHMLAIFYAVTRLVRRLPVVAVFFAAAALQTLYQMEIINTGWSVIDRFCDRYVYFFVGYAAAPRVFAFAQLAGARPPWTLALLLVWGVANSLGVQAQLHDAPGTSLLMGFIGAAAIVSISVLLSQLRFTSLLRHAGANSIVVYLTFFLPLKVMHKLFFVTGIIADTGWVSAITTTVAVAAPLIFHHYIKNTPLNFLYVRPARFRIVPMRGSQTAAAGNL
jgi:uncharacterized membrane protein YcfT